MNVVDNHVEFGDAVTGRLTEGTVADPAPREVAPPEALIPETGGSSGIELRGYELAQLEGDRWRVINKYRPNEGGFQAAARDGGYLAERHPKNTYRVRPVISVPFPETHPDVKPNEPPPEETSNG